MSLSEEPAKRLPFSFHQTFIPERVYLKAMLEYAAAEKSGNAQSISAETGIPTGRSSGKVPAILDYCFGMGLISLSETKTSVKNPRLLPFGRIVLLEDRHFSEALTQWLAHFHLCRSDGGAEVWFLTFAKGINTLGSTFVRERLEVFLEQSAGGRIKTGLIGPLIRMYEDPAGFEKAGVLTSQGTEIVRKIAPVVEDYTRGYAAWILTLLEARFPNQRQVTLSDLESATFWQAIAGWSASQAERVLEMVQNTGAIDVDRQMRPWVLTRIRAAADIWPTIYEDLP